MMNSQLVTESRWDRVPCSKDVLSFSGTFQSLILDDTDPSHRDSLLLSDLSLPDQGKNMKLTMQLHQHVH